MLALLGSPTGLILIRIKPLLPKGDLSAGYAAILPQEISFEKSRIKIRPQKVLCPMSRPDPKSF